MHEMGIANSILEAARREAQLYPAQRPARVGVVIGEYAGVDTESLRFCFEVLAKDQQPMPLQLDISWLIGSDELKLAYLELDDVPMEEVSEEVSNDSCDREESPKRKRSNRRPSA